MTYSADVCVTICDMIMEGKSLRSICGQEGMPSLNTVLNWLADDTHEFCAKYARAREVQAEYLADQMMDIANDGRNDWMEANGSDNVGWRLNGESTARSKLRLEQARWNAEKLRPKKYGAKVDVNHAGTVGLVVQATKIDEDV